MPKPLPPPLPPATRTVGQLVGEAIRLYGRRFWRALALGIPLAVFDQLALGQSAPARAAVFAVAAPFFAAAYVGASALAAGVRPTARSVTTGVALGTCVLAPVALLVSWFALLAVAYLALVGLVVPVAVIESPRPLAAFRRAGELGRADYVHALGSLAALVLVFFVARIGLVALLQAQAENTVRAAVALADLVLSPLLFLGAALLYFDQAARFVHSGTQTRRRKSDADLHPAVDADRAGRPDAEVQP
jgi:hypothetical protein